MSDNIVVLIMFSTFFRFSDLQFAILKFASFAIWERKYGNCFTGAETKVWRKVPFISISLNAVIADIFGNMTFVHFVLLFVCPADLCP